MAIAVDTIEILRGLVNEQTAAASIMYTIDSATGSAVSSRSISVPVSDGQANVIFNNDYDLDGSTVFVRVRKTKFTDGTAGAIVKTETQDLAWVEIPGGASEDHIIESGDIDISDCLSCTLHIDVCLSSTTAHTGTEVVVQTGTKYTNLTKYTCCVGTAVLLALDATEPIGEKVIACTNPVATGFDWDGKNIFIENTTPANCEIVYQTEHGADA